MIKQLVSGLLIGVIVPIIGIFLVPLALKPSFTASDILNNFWMNSSFSPTIQLSLVLNLGVFFLLNKFNRDIIARGVIAGTLVWGVYLFIIIFGK